MSFEHILTEEKDGILHITINREKAMNALNISLLKEIGEAIDVLYDENNLKGAILTGSGNKAFAAGADISEFANFHSRKGVNMARSGHRVFTKIENSPKPIIAAVNGFALGGGCELAMACHMRVASENAKFGQPEVNLGIIPGYGGTQRLIQLIGKGKAIELLMTGDMIDAQEAHRLGLANHVVPQETLIDKATEILNKIGKKAPLAIARITKCVEAYFNTERDGFNVEIEEFGASMDTEDFKEGTSAFLEKRKAEFKGK